MEPSYITKLAKAYDFAARKHSDQRRAGLAAEPYINHLAEVAALVAEGTQGEDVDLIIAAVLHDTVEDTHTTMDELTRAFGGRVAGLVAEVTDDKSLAKVDRKRLQIEHAAHASLGAQIIKLADKTSNVRSLTLSPPATWSRARKLEYVAWARLVVTECRHANPWLTYQFEAAGNALDALPA